jgi:multidrug resistance efflux pump
LIVLGLSWIGWYYGKPLVEGLNRRERPLPTFRVQRGTVEIRVHTIGELRSVRSGTLSAPSVWGGGSLQILKLAKTGTLIREGEVVLEFDPSEQEYRLQQEKVELEQAEQEITKAKADAAVQEAQDQVDLLAARFTVRRAELEVSRNELVGAIDARKNDLTLEEARRRLTQLEKDVETRAASSKAGIAVMEAGRDHARFGMDRAKQNIDNMVIKAPITGLVAVRENSEASGGFFYPGIALPEYREGDMVFPGQTIAQILDIEQMEIQARINEIDRANLNETQPIMLQVDSLPGQQFDGRVKSIAGMASMGDMFLSSGVRQFDSVFEIQKPDTRLRPGVTARVVIIGEKVKDVLYLPRQALFEKDGKYQVYTRQGRDFVPRDVKVKKKTESQVVIEGLAEGTEVALVIPQEKKSPESKTAPSMGPAMGGGQR